MFLEKVFIFNYKILKYHISLKIIFANKKTDVPENGFPFQVFILA